MSNTTIVPYSFLPRTWLMPTMPTMTTCWSPLTTALWFDAFDELDLLTLDTCTTPMPIIQWLNKPECLATMCPTTTMMKKCLQKYRIMCDISGFCTPLQSIKCEWQGEKLCIYGKEEIKEETGCCMLREFKKTFEMPANCEHEKMCSYIFNSMLIIEVPLKDTMPMFCMKELLPHMSSDAKTLTLNITLPMTTICMNKLDIVCKDRDLIIKCEDTLTKTPCTTKSTWTSCCFYKKLTLPENVMWSELKCEITGGNMLCITCPLFDMEKMLTTKMCTTMPFGELTTTMWKSCIMPPMMMPSTTMPTMPTMTMPMPMTMMLPSAMHKDMQQCPEKLKQMFPQFYANKSPMMTMATPWPWTFPMTASSMVSCPRF